MYRSRSTEVKTADYQVGIVLFSKTCRRLHNEDLRN
jgi:hypothetical protein